MFIYSLYTWLTHSLLLSHCIALGLQQGALTTGRRGATWRRLLVNRNKSKVEIIITSMILYHHHQLPITVIIYHNIITNHQYHRNQSPISLHHHQSPEAVACKPLGEGWQSSKGSLCGPANNQDQDMDVQKCNIEKGCLGTWVMYAQNVNLVVWIAFSCIGVGWAKKTRSDAC